MGARLADQVFDMRLAALAWLFGFDAEKIGEIVDVSEAAVYNRMDEIRAIARAMRTPPTGSGERRAA
jgi:hypothetical protein